MQLISSKTTFINKRVFPAIWFGFLIVFIGVNLYSTAGRPSVSPVPFVVMPLFMMVFGYFLMKKLVFGLVDEVWDTGSSLVVKNRGQEQTIALRDIKNVSYSPYMNPPRVTLSLRQPTDFGDEITFGAPMRPWPFWTSPVIKGLIERVDRARAGRA